MEMTLSRNQRTGTSAGSPEEKEPHCQVAFYAKALGFKRRKTGKMLNPQAVREISS
jgi:hypothetical protein